MKLEILKVRGEKRTNKSTTVNRFVPHTFQRNFTHLAVITRKTNIKLGILKEGTGKEPFKVVIIQRKKAGTGKRGKEKNDFLRNSTAF